MATKNKKTSTAAPTEQTDLRVRVIKKYPNRRLYDTLTSNYIALSDIKQLVMSGAAFKVIDAKTEEDITRSLLLQIILEEEAGGAPLFSEAVLSNIIRTYGHAMQGFMGSYLEKNLQVFADMQKQITTQALPMNATEQVFKPEAWTGQMTALQDQMMSMFGMKKP
ncbi:MAG: polyhydroxyalkanoate synthesis repressor PhaR [Pseudomonadota bacterium]